jgi:serine/threonine protein kinase/tetratricopeptide (TPR) repeat protein
MSERETIEKIFLEAVELPAVQRDAFLRRRCGDDQALRAAVEELIAADQQAGDGEFLRSNLFGKEEAGTNEVMPDDVHRFRVIRAYRQGGLGEVLLAHDRQLDRDVAVKQIKPKWKDSVEAKQRFVQEAKVTGRLEHPGVVPVYAAGTWPDGQQYYAMRFIEGDTMKDAIDQYHRPHDPNFSPNIKRLELRELLTRFVDVCNTIQYAHSRQVLHRDIKPSNIMVGPYGETLVVDWGLAKLLDGSAEESMTADLARALADSTGSTPTQVGGTVGTPQYMSPEQAKGKLDGIGTRTDVYLLGATLYQILTGQPPHQEDSLSRLLKRISQGILTRPREIQPDVAPALESICLKAMATDPADRYIDPNQVAEDVNRWMADQPVSVHHDSASVRINRWMRIHRTATSTIAVSMLLLAIGGVFGSILWNVAKVRKFQAEEERRTKEFELEVKDQQRVAELELAAKTAEELAEKEIARNRFSSAYDVLQNTLPSIRTADELGEQAARIGQKADRLGAIVDFYRLSDVVEQQNVLSRDTKAVMACTAALKRLGIWDRPDWWTALPDQELSQQQIDTLRWDVYQQLMLMDAMLVKSIGTRLSGEGHIGGPNALLRAAGRMLTTNAGKAEAQAALIVSDRIDRFRVSESTRLYRSIAKLRLGKGSRVPTKELGLTLNSADAHSMAVLSTIAFLDPNLKLLFGGYQNDDPLLAARNLFGRSASLRPKYYGAQLGLGQIEYLIAARNPAARWEDFSGAIHAFGQCITLLPDRCFAYADRSSTYRIQAELLSQDDRYDESERQQLVSERLRWSLADASRAMQFYPQHPWIGWQTGQIYAEMGQVDRAVELWIQTAMDTYPLGETADATFVQVDDLRGRAEIGDWLEDRLAEESDQALWNTRRGYIALAGVRLNQARHDEALVAVRLALSIDPQDIAAKAIRGMILLLQSDFESAEIDFQEALAADPDHPFASFGLAVCFENEGRFSESSSMFQRAESVALTGENQAAAALGRCRMAAVTGDFIAADQAIRRAIAAEPACDLFSVARRIAITLRMWKRSGSVPPEQIARLTEFTKSLADLPRATRIAAMPKADGNVLSYASILNGGFELGSLRYWSDSSGAHWETTPGFDSTAIVTDEDAHSGTHCLRLDAKIPDGNSGNMPVGKTGQEFSIVAGQTYSLECWAKAKDLADSAVRIIGPAGRVLIEFDAGNYDWRRVTGQFQVTAGSQNQPGSPGQPGQPVDLGTIIPCQLQIVATGTGTLWLDDFSCRTQMAEK